MYACKCMYQFDPMWIVHEKYLNLPTNRFFCFWYNGKNQKRKWSTEKKSGCHRASTEKDSHTKLTQRSSLNTLRWSHFTFIEHILVQWKFLSANRKGRDGEPFGTELCVSLHGAYRGTNLRSVHGNKTSPVQNVKDISTILLVPHPSLNFTWVIPRTYWSRTSWLETFTCFEMTQTLETFTDHYEFCVHTVAIPTCATPWWEVIWTTQLLQSKIVVHFHAVGLDAILAPTPMLHLRSTLLGDISLLIPSTPVQATTWYTLSNVVPATRFTSEKQEDAWEIDSENTYVQHDKPTLIFP